MDAFSSDAIPMHLLTTECVEMYWKHLKPDGILVVNISNRNVDLTPIIRAIADLSDKQARICESRESRERDVRCILGADYEQSEVSRDRRGQLADDRRSRGRGPGRVDRRLRQPMASAGRFDASEIREWIDDQREWIHEQIEEYWPSKAAAKKKASEKPNEADVPPDADGFDEFKDTGEPTKKDG